MSHQTVKEERLQQYWNLSRAYRGQGDRPMTMEGLIKGATTLAGQCNTTWLRLENHSADLLNSAIQGKRPRAKKVAPQNVVQLRQAQA